MISTAIIIACLSIIVTHIFFTKDFVNYTLVTMMAIKSRNCADGFGINGCGDNNDSNHYHLTSSPPLLS